MYTCAGGAVVSLRGALGASVTALGAGPYRHAPGWDSVPFQPYRMEQVLKSHAARFEFGEYRFAAIRTLRAIDVRAARPVPHDLRSVLLFEIRHTIPSAGRLPRCKPYRPESSIQPWCGRPIDSLPRVRYARRPCPRWCRGRGPKPNSSARRGFRRRVGPYRKWLTARQARWEPVRLGVPPATAIEQVRRWREGGAPGDRRRNRHPRDSDRPRCSRSSAAWRCAGEIVPRFEFPLVSTDLSSSQLFHVQEHRQIPS